MKLTEKTNLKNINITFVIVGFPNCKYPVKKTAIKKPIK